MSTQHTPSQVAFLDAIARGRHRKGSGSRLRSLVAQQEREQFGVLACFCCGLPVMAGTATLEHIKSQASGGGWDLPNLALSHSLCNERRGDSNSPRAPLATPGTTGAKP